MSTTIDSKVVEMRFDNKHFESNVSTTMSTLDKLKQKLHLDGATKGLENVGSAVKKVDFTPLSTAAETVQAKFSAMQVMAVTALANITNSAVNAGKRMVAALTIDPVRTGFSEYELKLDSVKTIMASTGEDVKVVNKYLGELNEYSDQTIYSFADMTQNIGKFTNAGVKLEDAVAAIKGISNEAALSGANANEASRAMYNFAQALSSGYVKLIDWKSIENANMATVQFKEELIKTALEMGTVTKAGDGMYKTLEGHAFNATKNFNDVLQDQWMTSEVLVTTLRKYADETTDIGKRAKAAATEVTKVTQIFDILKETAQSGWAQTWELIIGDIDTAKKILTPINNALSGFIDMISDWRNRVLQIALDISAPWKELEKKISKITGKVDKVVSGVTGTLEYFQDVVDRVWMGDFNNWGDNPDRRDLLRAAGYDPRVVQYLVNLGEEAWHSGKVYKLSMEEVEAAHKKYGLTVKTTKEETEKVTEAFNGLSDEMLESAGLTEDEIRLYRALEKEANKLGISISELAEDMSKNNGRDLLVKSLKNIGKAIVQVANICKTAYIEIFNPPSAEEMGIGLYGLIRRFKDFTDSLTLVDKKTKKLTANGEKVKDIFKGVFALIDIIVTLSAGPLRIVFNVLTQLLGIFGYTLFDAAAALGRLIVKFRDGFDGVVNFTKIIEKMAPYIKAAAEAIRDWAIAMDFKGKLEKATGRIDGLVESFKTWIETLKDSKNLPQDIAKGIMSGMGKIYGYIKSIFSKIWSYVTGGFSDASDYVISGFVNGIWNGMKIAGQVMVELGKLILAKFEGVLGIESPSKEAQKDGEFFMIGFWNGLKEYAVKVLGFIKDFGLKCIDFIRDLDIGTVIAAVIGIGAVRGVNKIADAFGAFGEIGEGIGDVLEGAGKALKSFSGMLKTMALENTARAMKEFAIAIAILVGAIVVLAYVCGQKNMNVWEAVGVIGALAVILGVLAAATSAISKSAVEVGKTGIKMKSLTTGLLGIAAAILVVALAVRIIGSMDPEAAKAGFDGLLRVITSIIAVLLACKVFVTGDLAGNMDAVGKTILKIALAMLVLVFVAKLIAGMEWEDMAKAAIGMAGLINIVALLMVSTKLVGSNANKIGSTMVNIAIAMAALVLVAKLIAGMEWEDMWKAAVGLSGLVAIIAGLMAATRLAGSNANKVGGAIFGVAIAMLLMTHVVKLIADIDVKTLAKGIGVIAIFAAIIASLIYSTEKAGKDAHKAGLSMIAIATAIAILAGIAVLLGLVKIKTLAKGLVAVGLLSIMVSIMLNACRDVGDIKGSLITLVAAVVLITAALIALTFIDVNKLMPATAALATVMAAFSLMIYSIKNLEGCNFKKIVGPLVTLAGVFAILAGVLMLMSLIKDPAILIPSATALGILMSVMTGVMAIISVLSKRIDKKSIYGIGLLSLMVIPLLLFTDVLARMADVKNAVASAQALVLLVGAMTLILAPLTIIGILGKYALIGIGVLAALMAALLISMAAIGGLMSLVPEMQGFVTTGISVLIQLATGIGDMIAAFTSSVSAAGLLQVLAVFLMMPLLTIGMSLLLPLMVTIGVLATTIGGLMNMFPALGQFLVTGMPILTKLAVAIGDLITAFTTTVSSAGLLEVLAVFLMMPLLTAGLYLLLPMMLAIGALALAISDLMMWIPNLEQFLDIGIPILVKMANGLGMVIGSFVAGIAAGVMTILPQLGLCLSMFMINATPFVIGAKMIDSSVLAGVGILAAAIIAMTAADLIAGIASFITGGTSLPLLGEQLSMFMLNAMPFIVGAAYINEDMVAGVKALAETILILTAANVIEGLTSWFTGGSSLENFASQLPILGTGLNNFIANIGTFTAAEIATVSCAAEAIKTLAEAADKIPNSGGWVGAIVGENDLQSFAEQFPRLAMGLASIMRILPTFTEAELNTIKYIADAVVALATAADEIPNSGGWVGAIVGENNLQDFADQFPRLGMGISSMLNQLPNFTKKEAETIGYIADAVVALATAADEIPNSGGWVGAIVGENNLQDFADQFPRLGMGIASLLRQTGTLDDTAIATIKCAADMVVILANAANEIPESGGWVGAILGDNDLKDFADQFPDLGTGLKGFSDAVTGIAISSVYAATQAFKTIADASVSIPNNSSNLTSFGSSLTTLGGQLVTYFTEVGSIPQATRDATKDIINDIADVQIFITPSKLDAASGAITKLVTAVKKVGEIESGTGDALKKAVNNIAGANFIGIGKQTAADFIKGMDSLRVSAVTTAAGMMADIIVDIRDTKDYPGRFKSLGEKFALKIAEGIEAYADRAKIKVTSMISKTLTYVRDDLDYPGRYKSLGASCVSGFVAGIDENTFRAEAKAAAMAAAALTAAKNALAVNSPSKKFRDLGMSVPEGFALGIDKMGSVVNGSATSMATGAIDTVKKAIGRVSDMVSTDIDTQPTIRPVLDLSDVRSGASALSGMLDMNSSVGVQANIGAISSMMNLRGQNGANDDVVAALDSLNKKMDNIGNTTYNLNGMTYDDGSNIATAMTTIARAALKERRM